jgi:hypothetical protein
VPVSADAAFANAANAAATAFASDPPYVAYHLDLQIEDGGTKRAAAAQIILRTGDSSVVVIDQSGKHRRPAPPALPPTIDALADWAFTLDVTNDYPVMHVSYQEPLHYAFATPGTNVDVVVPLINGFSVRYADNDPTHLELQPATTAVKALAAQRDRFLYREVWIDPATWLPTRVTVAAIDGTLTLEYTTASGRWLLSHMSYRAINTIRHSTEHTDIEATYTDFSFPAADAEF